MNRLSRNNESTSKLTSIRNKQNIDKSGYEVNNVKKEKYTFLQQKTVKQKAFKNV